MSFTPPKIGFDCIIPELSGYSLGLISFEESLANEYLFCDLQTPFLHLFFIPRHQHLTCKVGTIL